MRIMGVFSPGLVTGLGLGVVLLVGVAGGQVEQGEVPLEDLLEVLLIDRDLVAIDANGGGQLDLRLNLGEELRWKQSRGRVGVALTDQRILAVGTGSGSWQRTRYRRTERPPESALLGDRVALITTNVRALGFSSRGGNLSEIELGPQERVEQSRVGANVALIVTNRRLLGYSPFTGRFAEFPRQIKEQVQALEALSNVGTVTTQRRVLIFRSPTGSWEARKRELRPGM